MASASERGGGICDERKPVKFGFVILGFVFVTVQINYWIPQSLLPLWLDDNVLRSQRINCNGSSPFYSCK